MTRNAHVPRSSGKAAVVALLPAIKFAIIEMGALADSRAMRKLWLGHGFKDVSPLWGDRGVESFASSHAIIEQWPAFKAALKSTDADWYYISGHHGRQFAGDWKAPRGDDQLAERVLNRHYNRQGEAGFFNAHYHDGQWENDSRMFPESHKHADSVYMTTTTDVGAIDPEYENPLFDSVRSNVKGVLLSACNTLIMRSVRMAFRKHFPNALIIGTWSRTKVGGTAFTDPILKGTDKRFFADPPKSESEIAHYVREINKHHFTRAWGIGIQYQDNAWYNTSAGDIEKLSVEYLWAPEETMTGPYNTW